MVYELAQIQEDIQEIIRVKATVNKWMSDSLSGERRYLMASTPEYDGSTWAVDLVATKIGSKNTIQKFGTLLICILT